MEEIKICGRCNRKLKTDKSIAAGFGPVCLKKHNEQVITEAEHEELTGKRLAAIFGQEKPVGGITNLKPNDLIVGDEVRVVEPFWFYDDYFEKDTVFTMKISQVNHNFEKWVTKTL
jgi:hypothetical protein